MQHTTGATNRAPLSSPTGTLWLCYGGMMCLAIAANLAPVYLTTFGETFGGAGGLTNEQLGRIPAVMFAGLVVGILISGPLADRWGGKMFALIGLALICLGLGLLGGAFSYGMLLAASAVLGCGGGVVDMVMSPIVSAIQPERRASALNWLHSFYCTGAVCTALMGSAAIKLGVPWRAVALVLIAFPAAIFVGFARRKLPPLVHEEATRHSVYGLLSQPLFWAALLVIFMCGATEIGMAQWLPAYTERGLGYSKAAGSMALAGFSVAMVAGRMSAGALGHHVQPFFLMLACCLITAVLFLLGCFGPYAPLALAACVAAGLSTSCLWPTTLALTADRFPHGGGSMFGLLSASGNVGCFVMPWVIGVLSEASTLRYGIAATTLCPLITIMLLLWMRPRHATA